MSPARILRTLDFGLMMSIAYPLKRDEREAVAAFPRHGPDETAPPPSALCEAGQRDPGGALRAAAGRAGARRKTTRVFRRPSTPGSSAGDVARLELKWAFGFAGDVIAFAAPTVVDGTLFVGSAGGAVQALDAKTGCVHWLFQASGPVRSRDDGRRRRRRPRAALQRSERRRLRASTRDRHAALEDARRRARGDAA